MVPSRTPSPTAHPVEALTKSTARSSWVPRQTRAQLRPPLLVVRMVPVPTAQTIPVSPMAWTASSRWMRPRGRLVVGTAGTLGVVAGPLGTGVLLGGVGAAVEWAVQPVTAMAAANMMAMTVRTGRMASSPEAA
jgi:hypothetical protein